MGSVCELKENARAGVVTIVNRVTMEIFGPYRLKTNSQVFLYLKPFKQPFCTKKTSQKFDHLLHSSIKFVSF